MAFIADKPLGVFLLDHFLRQAVAALGTELKISGIYIIIHLLFALLKKLFYGFGYGSDHFFTICTGCN